MFTIPTYQATHNQARRALARPDLYRTIHKALRASMCDVVVALGRLDVQSPDACDHTLLRAERLLDHLAAHLEHENAFLHPAIAQTAAAVASQTAGDHDDHAGTIAALRDLLQGLRDTTALRERRALALCLYRAFAAFVGENLVHMQVEESHNTEALWAGYNDAQLHALQARLLQHVDPQMLAEILPWMVRALAPEELAELYADMRANAPRAAYRAALDVARAELDGDRYALLERALMVPALAA